MIRTTLVAVGLVAALGLTQGCQRDQKVETTSAPLYEPRPLSEPVTMDLPPSPRSPAPVTIDPVGHGWSGVEAAPLPVPAAERIYVVQRGDTLWSIAARHYGDGKKLQQIAAANGMSDPNKLQVGQRLILP
jgi:nucleoid-associated protein YgaU